MAFSINNQIHLRENEKDIGKLDHYRLLIIFRNFDLIVPFAGLSQRFANGLN